MNFFYIETCPLAIAKSHNNTHCIKMILEYAQMLSTTHRVLDQYYEEVNGEYVFVPLPKDMQILYKIAHLNHPTTIWVRESVQHYNFMYAVWEALCDEYTYRYGKVHESDSKLRELLRNPPSRLEDNGFQEPPQCMPDEFKVEGDSLQAYRNFYIHDKKFKGWRSKYKKREKPEWLVI
tara:strand:+ start:180 stop:713 length:534 start_codon:yes stop_codon:yes gene_type:complete